MNGVLLYYAAGIACLFVLAVVMFGIVTFARGGEFNRKYANKIMRLRVAGQAVAVLLLLLVALALGKG